ncbi:hypothetical protein ACFFU4_17415 [Roseovarius ramblicola]|uniref:Uncharacterized protein n=1 Tax=Roseovarius ramblicola TaxID=2022336 RepID=A0ABV5I4B8_9RHOB
MDFRSDGHCAATIYPYVAGVSDAPLAGTTLAPRRQDMTRDELNRELRMHSASWQAVLIVYGAIVGTFVLSAMAVL